MYRVWAVPCSASSDHLCCVWCMACVCQGTGKLGDVETADWTPQTIDSWRHSVVVGMVDPWFVVARPAVWYKTVREIVTLERMHQAFAKGLMQYGMMRGTKLAAAAVTGGGGGEKTAASAASGAQLVMSSVVSSIVGAFSSSLPSNS